MSKRITRGLRIDEDLDQYLREVTFDGFKRKANHGAYSDVVNSALRAWMQEHKRLMQMSQEKQQ